MTKHGEDGHDWERLVSRARAGDPHAMDDLLAAARPLVLRRCAKFLPYRDDAEEAAQEALLTVATRLDDFGGRGSFAGWITVIASNQALQTYRSMKKRFGDVGPEVAGDRPDPDCENQGRETNGFLTQGLTAGESTSIRPSLNGWP